MRALAGAASMLCAPVMLALTCALTGALIVAGTGAVTAAHAVPANPVTPPALSANAGDPALVARGRAIYAAHCAACHGARLQGQVLWQVEDQDSWRRAPALDATGHAWLHSDNDLFRMTATGHYPGAKPGEKSAMPAFGRGLGDQDIAAALAYIEAHWPVALRVVQSALNPHNAGTPQNLAGTDWRFPPICRATD